MVVLHSDTFTKPETFFGQQRNRRMEQQFHSHVQLKMGFEVVKGTQNVTSKRSSGSAVNYYIKDLTPILSEKGGQGPTIETKIHP